MDLAPAPMRVCVGAEGMMKKQEQEQEQEQTRKWGQAQTRQDSPHRIVRSARNEAKRALGTHEQVLDHLQRVVEV